MVLNENIMKEIHDLDELKSIELRLMKVIHDVCTHNNIWYELAYGTLIGAVRHNGFIPWDDDIDIFMYRKDLNKFLEAIERHKESDHIMIASPKNGDIYFPRDIIKVCDSRTKLFEKTYKHEPIGVFVDIWPIDNSSDPLDSKWVKEVVILRNLALSCDISKRSDEYGRMGFAKKMAVNVSSFFNRDEVLNKQIHEAQKYHNNSESTYVIAFQAHNNIYRREWISDIELHKFENAEFYIPKHFDELLTSIYGDYMQLPPANEQNPHHIQDVWWIE